jgi:hypothetical protein
MNKGASILGRSKKSRDSLINATPALRTDNPARRICAKGFREELWRIEIDVDGWRVDIVPCGVEMRILE